MGDSSVYGGIVSLNRFSRDVVGAVPYKFGRSLGLWEYSFVKPSAFPRLIGRGLVERFVMGGVSVFLSGGGFLRKYAEKTEGLSALCLFSILRFCTNLRILFKLYAVC